MTDPTLQHRWDVSPDEAIAIQQRLRGHVITHDDFGPVQTVAGVDIGFEDDGATTRAAVVVLDFPALTVRASALSRRPTSFPYIPGLLSFREVPAALDALAQLDAPPDLLLVDGQGTMHPRRLGIACHLGLLSNIPAIGVAKSYLLGQHAPLAEERGAWQPVYDEGERIGVILRSRTRVRPIYVSAGHRISQESALDYTLRCLTRYRLPETTRQAHNLASRNG
jgi:deoxyribonuclease V